VVLKVVGSNPIFHPKKAVAFATAFFNYELELREKSKIKSVGLRGGG
jgi:hypothetical protein